jgi:hypothetical protein
MEQDIFNLIKWLDCSLDVLLIYMMESSSILQMHRLHGAYHFAAGKGKLRRLYSAYGRRCHVASSIRGRFPSN